MYSRYRRLFRSTSVPIRSRSRFRFLRYSVSWSIRRLSRYPVSRQLSISGFGSAQYRVLRSASIRFSQYPVPTPLQSICVVAVFVGHMRAQSSILPITGSKVTGPSILANFIFFYIYKSQLVNSLSIIINTSVCLRLHAKTLYLPTDCLLCSLVSGPGCLGVQTDEAKKYLRLLL